METDNKQQYQNYEKQEHEEVIKEATKMLADDMEDEGTAAEAESGCNALEVEEEEQDENVDDEMISLASSDLSMADEAFENSEENEDESDEVTECGTYDPIEEFDPDSFKPTPTKHIRPPWFKHSVAECDAKNWEIFVEALEAFDHETIFEGIDDFIVTVETLLPHLPSCFVTLMKDTIMTEKEAASRIMVWLEVCFSKDVQTFEEAKKMHDIAFGILKTVAESSKSSAIGKHLVESGIMELLVVVLEESECAELRMGALHALFQLISSPLLWRTSNARFCEVGPDDPKRALYARVVALSFGDRYFIGKNFLHLLTLLISWSRYISALSELECASRKLVAAVYEAGTFKDLPVTAFTEKWNAFILSLEGIREYIVQYDDEKVCASFDVYAPLQSSDLLGICMRVITMSRVVDRWPNVLQLISFLLNDKYYGTLFIVHDAELVPMCTELKSLAERSDKTSQDKTSENFEYFEEGICEMDAIFPTAKELRLTILYRLRALHLLDELRSCAGTMRHNIDDNCRVSALLSLCELCNDASGRGLREVVWILAQKYVYYLIDIIECACAHSSLRSSASFLLSLHLLSTVVAEVDEPRFWLRNAKAFSRLVSAKTGITFNMHKKLYEYLAPFSDPSLQAIGTTGLDVVASLIKKMKSSMERRIELTPALSAIARVLEAVLLNTKSAARLELFHTMEQDGTLDTLAQWLFELVQHRHAMWQMGEPASSEASKRFLVFAFPIVRIFSSYIRVCNGLIEEVVKVPPIRGMDDIKDSSRDLHQPSNHPDELRRLSDVMMDAVFLMWSSAGGMNGQRFNPECRRIRLAVLDVLTPSLFNEKSLAMVVRHVLLRSCSRPHLFAAALSLLMNLAPSAPPLIIGMSETLSWKDVVIGHRQRVNRFVHAFFSCENRVDIAEIVLSPSPYVSELALHFVGRMSRLDRRLAQDLASILLNYIVASLKVRPTVNNKDHKEKKENKESVATPAGSVTGDDVSKENEDSRPASTGMVRLMESLVHLCSNKLFRMVLYEYLSQYPCRVEFLMPILAQFEKPTSESERQSRFQHAVLKLLSGLCRSLLWSTKPDLEFSDCEGCPPIGSTEVSPSKGNVSCSTFYGENRGKLSRTPSVEIIEDNNEEAVTALELGEEKENDSRPSSTLHAIVSSLCCFVNNVDQKLTLVRQALEILAKASSSAIKEENEPFVEVIRGCLLQIGIGPLFERLNKSFGADEVMTCLLTIATALDSLIGDQAHLLHRVLKYSPSDHPLISIITKINALPDSDASAKCVLKILHKFFETLNNHSITHEGKDTADDVKIPIMYGKSAAVAKAYHSPAVEAVAGTREFYTKIRIASSILVKRQKTVGTRMGTEVAKIVDANKGKEKAMRKLLRTQLGLREPNTPRDSLRKRTTSDSKEAHGVKQKRV